MIPRECLKRRDDTVPEECRRLAYSFFECKRSIVSVFMISPAMPLIDFGSAQYIRIRDFCFDSELNFSWI